MKFADVAKRAGVDAFDIFRHVGADLRCMAEPELHVPERWVANILEATERRTSLVTPALAIAKAWRMSDIGPLSLLLQHQPTVRHVLGQYETYRHVRSETVSFRVQEIGELAVIRLTLQTERGKPSRHSVELTLGTFMVMLRWVLGAGWHPREMRFAHAAPRNLEAHQRVFGCRVEFGCDFDGIVMNRADLDRTNPHGDVNLARYAKEFLDHQSPGQSALTTLSVRRSLEFLLPQGRCTLADVAAQMGTSARTLQRRLAQESTEFSIVQSEVRLSLAIRYLRDPRYPVSQVALLLGFSEPSAFSRWFVAQFGRSPRQWRIRGAE